MLSVLEGEVAQFALAEIERQPGAAEKLAAHREKIDAARRAADKLRAALELAERLDREADAVSAATLRAEQLALFERAGAERVQAMTKIIQCVATSAEAFERYVAASRRMISAVPMGTRLPLMALGNGDGGNWLGDGELLIGREAYRLAELAGAPKLPFAKPPPPAHGTSAERTRRAYSWTDVPKMRAIVVTIPSAVSPSPTMTISTSIFSHVGICLDGFMVLRLLAPAHGAPLGQGRK